jgi:hypothetical protein
MKRLLTPLLIAAVVTLVVVSTALPVTAVSPTRTPTITRTPTLRQQQRASSISLTSQARQRASWQPGNSTMPTLRQHASSI